MKILIIEDNQEAAESLRMILEMEGHHVITMPSGHESLQYLKLDTGIDVIILDHYLPQMSSIVFLFELRETLKKSIPVILATGATDLDVERLNQMQPLIILTKPFDPGVLVGVLNSSFKSVER